MINFKQFTIKTTLKKDNVNDIDNLYELIKRLIKTEHKDYQNELMEIWKKSTDTKFFLLGLEQLGYSSFLFNMDWKELKKSFIVYISFKFINFH